jgi:phosphoserine/homoserine phosphotransferase
VDIICLDLEGVLVPEIWITFAKITGIAELKATTRDIPDYDELMTQRLAYLDQYELGLTDIQAAIGQMRPMDGARDFLNTLREQFQVVILSDTFYEFAQPLMRQLGWPTLFCHQLEISEEGTVTGYLLRQKDAKRKSVQALQELNYRILAAGDSYNDVGMLEEADAGFLFKPPQNVIDEFPQYPVAQEYSDLNDFFAQAKSDDS